jgi:glycerol kinase
MTKFIAAIDQGTTSTRCILFDHQGNSVGMDQKEHRQIYPRPGWGEHNAMEILQNSQEVFTNALRPARDGGLAAIGITNQRELQLSGIVTLAFHIIMQLSEDTVRNHL